MLAGALQAADTGRTRLPSLAVLRFESSRIDSADLEVLRDAMAVEVQNSGRMRVMERAQMNAILSEQGFQKSGACDRSECAVEVGRILAVDRMLLGSVGKIGETWSVTVRIVDVETGEVLSSARDSRTGAIEVLLSGSVPLLARQLTQASSVPPPVAAEPARPAPAAPMAIPVAVPEVILPAPLLDLVTRRAFVSDSGFEQVRRQSVGLTAAQLARLQREGFTSRWAAVGNAIPFLCIGTYLENDRRGLWYCGAAWTPWLLSALGGGSNGALFLLGWGFQIGRPIYFAGWSNERLRDALGVKTSWIPAPTLQRVGENRLVPALTWSL